MYSFAKNKFYKLSSVFQTSQLCKTYTFSSFFFAADLKGEALTAEQIMDFE